MKKIIAVLSFLALVSCATQPAPGWTGKGEALPRGLTLEVNGQEVIIKSPYLGTNVQVYGTLVEKTSPDLGYTVELTHLDYFQNWAQGWTEGTFQIAGELDLTSAGGEWTIKTLGPVEILSPQKALIRYKDTYLSGDQALTALRDRWNRITTALEGQPMDRFWSESARGQMNWLPPSFQPRFEQNAGSHYFPEIYGYPQNYQTLGPWVDGESILWDQGYTQSTFPENLQEVRNTGTLYRDWEEGLGLWYLAAQWKYFWEQKIPATVLNKQ